MAGDGMLMHSCFREGEKLAFLDVWENREAFRDFRRKAHTDPERDRDRRVTSDVRRDDYVRSGVAGARRQGIERDR